MFRGPRCLQRRKQAEAVLQGAGQFVLPTKRIVGGAAILADYDRTEIRSAYLGTKITWIRPVHTERVYRFAECSRIIVQALRWFDVRRRPALNSVRLRVRHAMSLGPLQRNLSAIDSMRLQTLLTQGWITASDTSRLK